MSCWCIEIGGWVGGWVAGGGRGGGGGGGTYCGAGVLGEGNEPLFLAREKRTIDAVFIESIVDLGGWVGGRRIQI